MQGSRAIQWSRSSISECNFEWSSWGNLAVWHYWRQQTLLTWLASTRFWTEEIRLELKTELRGKCLPTFTVILSRLSWQNLHAQFIVTFWFAILALLAEIRCDALESRLASFHRGAVTQQKILQVRKASCIAAPPNISAKKQFQTCCRLCQNRQFYLEATLNLSKRPRTRTKLASDQLVGCKTHLKRCPYLNWYPMTGCYLLNCSCGSYRRNQVQWNHERHAFFRGTVVGYEGDMENRLVIV